MPMPKKPTALRRAQGNPGKVKGNKSEPQPTIIMPTAPENMSEFARQEWERITPILYRLGLLSEIDTVALAMYCDAVSTWRQAKEQLAIEGLTISTTNGNVIQNPVLGIRNKAMELAHKFLIQFGMTPASRANVTTREENKNNPLAKFIKK